MVTHLHVRPLERPCALTHQPLTRRRFLAIAALGTAWSCGRDGVGPSSSTSERLSARPGRPTGALEPGEHAIALGTGRDGLIYVPRSIRRDAANPLAVMLHGAGATGRAMSFTFQFAEESGVIVVAPDSREQTWDAILGGFGPDVEFINQALAGVFAGATIDPTHLAVGGFSDGASYGLSLGLANGDLFTHVIAFSPGFIAGHDRRGKPAIFLAHGTNDAVLPIERTSRLIVPELRGAGYNVTYREFPGPHTVPDDIARQAFGWFLQRQLDPYR